MNAWSADSSMLLNNQQERLQDVYSLFRQLHSSFMGFLFLTGLNGMRAALPNSETIIMTGRKEGDS